MLKPKYFFSIIFLVVQSHGRGEPPPPYRFFQAKTAAAVYVGADFMVYFLLDF
jgi:hypothetical protein